MSEWVKTDPHGEASIADAESARIRAKIRQFFESYRHAFDLLDAEGVARNQRFQAAQPAHPADSQKAARG